MQFGKGLEAAFQHMVVVLFRPFALRKWLAFGFVALIGFGGFNLRVPTGSGGGRDGNPWGGSSRLERPAVCTFASLTAQAELPGKMQTAPFETQGGPFAGSPDFNPFSTLGIGTIILIVTVGVVLLLVLLWLSSVFQFVYLEEIVRNTAAIKEPFHRLKGLGKSYFLWRVALYFLGIGGIAVVAAILYPVFARMGDRPNYAGLAVMIVVGVALLLVVLLIDLFTRDYVVAVMYAKGQRVLDAWGAFLPTLKANAGNMVVYVLILIPLAIALFIFAIVVALVTAIPFLLVAGILALIGYVIYSAAGEGAMIPLIAAGVTLGVPLLLAYVYAVTCAAQPAYVFRRSFPLSLLGQMSPEMALIPTGIPQPSQE